MKKIILIALAVLLVGGGVAYFVTKDDDTSTSQSSTSEQTATEEQIDELPKSASLQSLAGGDKPYKCTMTYTANDVTYSGTMYADGSGNGRMTAQSADGAAFNMIVKNSENTTYTWVTTDDGKTQGFKFAIPASTEEPSTNTQTTTAQPNQNFDVNCEEWTVDAAMLTLPSGVTFIDPSALVPNP